ncbi:IS66 family insertion sequence element accessory protein TnpB [Burkholderia sp. MS455]|nr:IS66 family insertion sequence element accessory protein TnpB [Burkholderia sp. MS455]
MKVLVYDGLGVWLATRRLNKGRFAWGNDEQAIALPGNSTPQLNFKIANF